MKHMQGSSDFILGGQSLQCMSKLVTPTHSFEEHLDPNYEQSIFSQLRELGICKTN